MKKIMVFTGFILILAACENFFSNKNGAIPLDTHTVIIKESIGSNDYTFVLASENDTDIWIAIPHANIKIGGAYYYQGGLIMYNFASKELKRTFKQILFLEGLSNDKENLITTPALAQKQQSIEKHININAYNLKRITIHIKSINGRITLSELYAKKALYAGKMVKLSGIVTRFSADIMKKNWVHLQDGTEYAGKFDLVISTKASVSIGDTIIMQGLVAVNKDFGYGYFYEVLLEDATIIH